MNFLRINRTRFLALALIGFSVTAVVYISSALSGHVRCDAVFAKTKPMPVSGENFGSYCLPCIAALRTYAREPVIDTVVAAFEKLNSSHPKTRFLYGEIGFPDGGRFRPHRSHREGFSVDLMVPLQGGKSLPVSVVNRYGYDLNFDSKGNSSFGKLDFAALGSLIVALDNEAKARGGSVRRIFFAPDLQLFLKAAGPARLSQIQFNKKQSWVRHDDHIHVDFSFPCK